MTSLGAEKAQPTILEVMSDPELFRPTCQGDSWRLWRAFLATVFGLPLSEAETTLVRDCTGREAAPTAQAREVWTIVGRRGGKSRVAALLAVYLSCFRDYRAVLAPGERGTLMLTRRGRLSTGASVVPLREGLPGVGLDADRPGRARDVGPN